MKNIKIHEVGLRDGLQMESEPVPSITKIDWAKSLIDSGVDILQLGSFVHPVKVPQLADTDELFEHFNLAGNKPAKTILSGLVLNEKGMERAFKCGTDMLCMGVSASDTHSKKNTGMTTAEALKRIIEMAKIAISAGKKVQVSVQSAFGCGFEGKISEDSVIGFTKEYLSAGINNISLADTAGHANPAQVERIFTAINELSDDVSLTAHFHNTYGMGMANCLTALHCGVKTIETAFGGLGGCPFTKQAAGNVCTEDFVQMLQKMGFRQDIDIDKIAAVARYASGFFVKELPGMVYKIGKIAY